MSKPLTGRDSYIGAINDAIYNASVNLQNLVNGYYHYGVISLCNGRLYLDNTNVGPWKKEGKPTKQEMNQIHAEFIASEIKRHQREYKEIMGKEYKIEPEVEANLKIVEEKIKEGGK